VNEKPGLLICVTTFPDRKAAESVAERLVTEGLVACAQVGGGIVSFYRWQDEICRDEEVRLTLKLATERWAACERRLVELHPHDVPQVLAWEADRATRDYARWARGEMP